MTMSSQLLQTQSAELAESSNQRIGYLGAFDHTYSKTEGSMLLHIYDLKNKVPGHRNYLFVYRNVESDGMAVRADECKLAIKKKFRLFFRLAGHWE